MDYFAIDVGSSFIKSAWLDLDKAAVTVRGKTPTPPFLPSALPGQKALSPEALAGAVRSALEEAYRVRPFEGIVFSSQMHGLQLFRTDGTPYGLMSTWQDETAAVPMEDGESAIDRLRKEPYASAFRRIGVEVSTAHTVSQLYAARLRGLEGSFYVASPADALIDLLCGAFLPVHPTIAHAFGGYDPDRGEWDEDLLRSLFPQSFRFPDIVRDETKPVGFIPLEGRKIPVFAPIGDQQAAVLGNLPGDNDLLLNIATGSQVIALEDSPAPGPYERRPYFEGRIFRTVTHIPAGRMLNCLIDFLEDVCLRLTGSAPARDLLWARATEAVGKLDGTSLSFDTSIYNTYGASSGGSVTGITPASLRFDQVLYAAYRDVARNFSESYRIMAEPGKKLDSILLTGGVAQRSPFLTGMMSEAFGADASLSPYPDEVLTGLLRLALRVSGAYPTLAATAERV